MKEEEKIEQLLQDTNKLEAAIEAIIQQYPSKQALMESKIPHIEKLKILQLLNYYMFSSEFLLSKRIFDGSTPNGIGQLLVQIRESERKI